MPADERFEPQALSDARPVGGTSQERRERQRQRRAATLRDLPGSPPGEPGPGAGTQDCGKALSAVVTAVVREWGPTALVPPRGLTTRRDERPAGGPDAVRAAVQEALDRLVTAGTALPEPASLYAALGRAVRAAVVAELGARAGLEKEGQAGPDPGADAATFDAIDAVAADTTWTDAEWFLGADGRLRAFAARNPPGADDAYIMYHFAGRTLAETAFLLGEDEATVAERIAYLEDELAAP